MFTAGETLEIWRAQPVQTSHGTRPGAPALVGTEDGWALAPPTPVDASEPDQAGRDMVVDRWDAYREEQTTQILAADQVKVPGDDSFYEVMGRPGVWQDPWTGFLFGTTMRLRRVNG